MKVTLDRSVDAAYIYLDEGRESGYVKKTQPLDLPEVNGEILLDFDGSGRLVGVEVLGASQILPDALMRVAQTPVVEVPTR